jgi:hypothetical protein
MAGFLFSKSDEATSSNVIMLHYPLREETSVWIPMAITLTNQEFEETLGGAKKAASRGPVFITDRGRPAHVLLTIEDYQRLAGGHVSLAKALGQPGADFDFDPPKAGRKMFKPADE